MKQHTEKHTSPQSLAHTITPQHKTPHTRCDNGEDEYGASFGQLICEYLPWSTANTGARSVVFSSKMYFK